MADIDPDTEHHNCLIRMLIHITRGLRWAVMQLADDEVRAAIFRDLGVDPGSVSGTTLPDDRRFTSIQDVLKSRDVSRDQLIMALEEMRAIYQALRDFVALSDGTGFPGFAGTVADQLLRLLTTNYIRLRYPTLYYWLRMGLFVDDAFSNSVLPGPLTPRKITSLPHEIAAFFNPSDDSQGPRWSLDDAESAQAVSDIVFPAATAALASRMQKWIADGSVRDRDILALYGWEPDPKSTTPIADRIANRMLSVSVAKAKPDIPDEPAWTLEATTALVSDAEGGRGLFLAVGGSASIFEKFGTHPDPALPDWTIKSEIGTTSGFAVKIPLGKNAPISDWPADAWMKATLEHHRDPLAEPVIFGTDDVHVELGDFKVVAGLSSTGPILRLVADKSALVVNPKRNAVTNRVAVGTEALRVQLSVGLVYSDGKFSIDGGSGLLLTVPSNLSMGGLSIRGVTLGIAPSSDESQPSWAFEIATTVVVSLGGFTLTVDRLGLVFDTRSKDFDLTSKGIGIAIKTCPQGVNGGGYLFYDRASSSYAGVLDLSLGPNWSLKGVGLVTTKIGGEDDLAVVVIITLEKVQLPLPMGFTLTGLGIILGCDREIKLDALEAGVRAHALDNILFPKDPIANAPAIVQSVAAIFPPAKDQNLFGGMIQVTWRSEKVVRAEVGVMVQGSGQRIVLLGKGRCFAPDEDHPVLKVLVDFIGDYDANAERIFLYLSLNGSKLGDITISGEAAMLWVWKDPGTFLLSLGGFNERYQAQIPPEFPSLSRFKLSLKKSDNINIEATFYFAITSNSVQIGGSLGASLTAGKFGVVGSASVDALFLDGNPDFVFDIKAKLMLKAWDTTLFMVSVEGTFAGWSPRHIRVKATFEIFIFSHTFTCEHSWGPSIGTPQQPVDVAAKFAEALADDASWTPELAAAARSLVTLRSDGATLLHPLGTIRVEQRVVPLGLDIDRFGSAPVTGQTLFDLSDSVQVGTAMMTGQRVKQQFARAQFFNLTDAEKLSSPAFEQMDAGLVVPPPPLTGGAPETASLEYKTYVYNPETDQADLDAPFKPRLDQVLNLSMISAAAKAADGTSGRARYAAPGKPVRIETLQFAVVSTEDGAATPLSPPAPTFSRAMQELRAQLAVPGVAANALELLPVAG